MPFRVLESWSYHNQLLKVHHFGHVALIGYCEKKKIIIGYCDRYPQSSTFSPRTAQLLSTCHLQYQQSLMQFQLCQNYSKLEKTGDQGLIPGLGRYPGEENSNQLQYTFLENPMDRGAWQFTVHGIARVGHNLETKPSQKRLVIRSYYIYIYTHICVCVCVCVYK